MSHFSNSASDWKLKMETPFFFHYTIKSSILLENRLAIVTEDGIFTSAFVKLQHWLIGQSNRNLCAFAFFSKEVYLTAQVFDTGLDIFKAEVIFHLEGAF